MNMILGLIVTYNPDMIRLEENISSIKEQVDAILIVDNGSENISHIEKMGQNRNFIVQALHKNRGIAAALSIGLEYATINNYEYIFTLDQDSICDKKIIDNLIDDFCIDSSVAICCPSIIEIDGEQAWRVQRHVEKRIVDRCPTSGCLCDVGKLNDVAGFNVELFIDEVDHDLCYRLQRKGYTILQDTSTYLRHEIGNPKKHWFVYRYVYASNHSCFRLYYIARNGVYIKREFKDLEHVRKRKIGLELLLRSIKIILYEEEKIQKLKTILLGFHDGKNFRTKMSINI